MNERRSITPSAGREKELLDYINNDADNCLRYGKLWTEFTVEEHILYAQYKIKRAKLLLDRNNESSRDDLIDSINSIRFAVYMMDRANKG